MVHHTDFGIVTLLANVLGGLQILAPGGSPDDESAWHWVRPRPGCLVVNLGDVMVQWTGGLLRINVHRIRHAPGAQRLEDRYSLALLVRPERDASMRRLVGDGEDGEDSELTVWEWEVGKAMALMRGVAVAHSNGGKPLVMEAWVEGLAKYLCGSFARLGNILISTIRLHDFLDQTLNWLRYICRDDSPSLEW